MSKKTDRDHAGPTDEVGGEGGSPGTTGRGRTADVAGVSISHADRVVYRRPRITKLDVARYFDEIGDWILPHVLARPLTLVHCPNGLAGACHYLRHAKAWGPAVLRRVRIQEKTKVGEYLVADSARAIVGLAQMGVLEIHTWNSTDDRLERPNRLVWDLDPGPGVAWAQTAGAARLLRDALNTLGLRSWVKTTGGKGLHLVVPIAAIRDWSACLEFARAVASAMAGSNPRLFTIAFAKEGRERKILIDYLRNNRTNTSVCAYSPRARDGAPVSTPLDWDEIDTDPTEWTLQTVPGRLRRLRKDPWTDYWTTRQRITSASADAVRSLGSR